MAVIKGETLVSLFYQNMHTKEVTVRKNEFHNSIMSIFTVGYFGRRTKGKRIHKNRLYNNNSGNTLYCSRLFDN
jgi:hypothetical protein